MQKANQGEELILHYYSHHQHPLVQVSLPYLFTCMGCKEYGAGKRFTCRRCDFNLHDFCALAPQSLRGHHFHSQHQLVLFTRPGGFLRSRCDVCSKPAKGYAFRCSSCNFEMHPCCSALQRKMDLPTHPHPLNISAPNGILSGGGSGGGDLGSACAVCRRKRLGRVYHCTVCDYHVHAVCAKDMINGLYANGIKAPEKPNKLVAAARLASNVFLGLIGGLIEGIGEGLGEALVESIGRSRGRNNIQSK